MPVSKKAHHAQFPETPVCLTISVTSKGVSVANVVATIDIPSNHHGIWRPERKNSAELFPARLLTAKPIINEITKKENMIIQSITAKFISLLSLMLRQ
jgi:hypothetical protein